MFVNFLFFVFCMFFLRFRSRFDFVLDWGEVLCVN